MVPNFQLIPPPVVPPGFLVPPNHLVDPAVTLINSSNVESSDTSKMMGKTPEATESTCDRNEEDVSKNIVQSSVKSDDESDAEN